MPQARPLMLLRLRICWKQLAGRWSCGCSQPLFCLSKPIHIYMFRMLILMFRWIQFEMNASAEGLLVLTDDNPT